MAVDRVQFQDVVASQLPRFVREDFPLLPDFLEQYYISQESQGGTYDLIQNIDQYVKVDQLCNLTNTTILQGDLDYVSTTVETELRGRTEIEVTTSSEFTETDEDTDKIYVYNAGSRTEGFPDTNGLIKINDEIIKYESKTDTAFINCSRGFSGITSYINPSDPDKLVFTTTSIEEHKKGAVIYNLNIIFLQEFFKKLKNQVAPGFEDRSLHQGIDKRNFIFNVDSFYSSKGTDNSFQILFNSLYGKDCEVIHPSTFLFRPSDADYKVTKDFVVESVQGDPLDLKNLTLFQKSTGASGAVSNVQKVIYDSEVGGASATIAFTDEKTASQYYLLSLDDNAFDPSKDPIDDFKPNPKTRLLTKTGTASTVLEVDSTVGFPTTGLLALKDINDDPVSLAYTGKSINQFFNVSGINELVQVSEETDIALDDYSYAYVGTTTDEQIQVRVVSTLKDFELENDAYYYSPGDTIKVKSLGIESDVIPASRWTSNIKTQYDVANLEEIDDSINFYKVNTYDKQYVKRGYNISLTTDTITKYGTVVGISSAKSCNVRFTSQISPSVDGYKLNNLLLMGDSSRYPSIGKYVTNVQNSYLKRNDDVLVASNSIPSYYSQKINPYNRSTYINGTLTDTEIITLTQGPASNPSASKDHGFLTGDAVWYEPEYETTTLYGATATETTIKSQLETSAGKLAAGVYYVKRVNSTQVKLARSKSNLFANTFLEVSGTVTNNQLIFYDFYKKYFEAQPIYRQIISPSGKSGNYTTDPGHIGIFNNGVEIINYKSTDAVYYGDIKTADVARGGEEYDVINPPLLHIEDSVGTGATGVVAVSGSLKEVRIIDQGFDFVDTPTIEIKGGNGSGAVAKVNISPSIHSVAFNAEATVGVGSTVPDVSLGTANSTIGFSTFHKFDTSEKVIYDTTGLQAITGLTTNAYYFVEKIGDYTIKLHTSAENARVGVDTVGLSAYGSGTHYIKSASRKNIVSSVVITDSGSGYQNKKRTIPTTGISTASNTISITNHGYESGEIIQYTAGGTTVGGLSETSKYYVRKTDDDSFSLSLVGTASGQEKYNYDNDIIVDLTSTGSGSFNYESITLEVKGRIGVQTTSGQDFGCKVQPIFRGSIDSIDITNGGVGYGASEVVNFERQPDFTLNSGKEAQLTPTISNGTISDVIIAAGGRQYNSPPDLIVKGPSGQYAQLTPILTGGVISGVNIINKGIGYTVDKTTIEVKAAGSDADIKANIKTWRINNFEKYYRDGSSLGLIDSDDGFLTQNRDSSSLQYGCLYAPRPLRESSYMMYANWAENIYPEDHYGDPDLKKRSGGEEDSPSENNHHSPILGYAYDGNPIYGNYGYSSREGGLTRQMKSGYMLETLEQRPPVLEWPLGFFVEDHTFTDAGDLDEHNGRFCMTPDYPSGVYAYFTTLEETTQSEGPFARLKKPTFPYVIGDTFASQPIDFNFKSSSNQTDYSVEENQWFRNTTVYHVNTNKSRYPYFFDSNKVRLQSLDVSAASVGGIDEVGILTGGTNYQYKDRISFDNTGTDGSDANAKVDRILGKEVTSVSAATTSFEFVEFSAHRDRNKFIGFASSPHGFVEDQSLTISGLSEYFDGFDGTYKVGVTSDSFVLNAEIGSADTTGIVTYFGVSGNLQFPSIRPNDILIVDTEKVKVLNIDAKQERIRVLRSQEGTEGGIHYDSAVLYEDPKKFTIEVGTVKTTKSLPLNKELYFDPAESVGLGTVYPESVGAGTTLVFSNPGTGATNVFVRLQHIYIPDHGLSTNDPVYYNTNGGTSMVVWDGVAGIGTTTLSNASDSFYAVSLGKDFLGISTNKVGVGTTTTAGIGVSIGAPNFVGIAVSTGLLYFTNVGAGDTHSFKTDLGTVVTGDVDRTTITVATASTHGLTQDDKIWMTVKPTGTTTISVKYDDYNRRMVFDPVGFTSGGVDLQKNTITYSNHTYKTGDKVVHTATTPCGGLDNESMYYVFRYSKDKIKLVSEKNQLTAANPSFIDITSKSTGTLSKINPLVELKRNNTLKFDLSDSSLSFKSGASSKSAFKLDLYKNVGFGEEYFTNVTGVTTIGQSIGFAVTTAGTPGIGSGAHLTLSVDGNTPSNLWYKFSLDNIEDISAIKKELLIDKEVDSYNQINLTEVAYSGQYNISLAGVSTFTYVCPTNPLVSDYDATTAKLSYQTNSSSAYGSIAKVKIVDTGFGYKSLPGITSIVSGIGTNAILFTGSSNIGEIKDTKFNGNGIGWNYPTDKTLKVVANLPEIVELESLTSFERVGISSGGINYISAPDLVVIDGFTKRKIDNVDLVYELGDEKVTIRKNTTGMYNVPPRIVPINNSNGVGISNVEYTSATKTVKIYLSSTFSDAEDFHYAVGDKVLIENLSIGVGQSGKNYNSANYPTGISTGETEYGYAYFTLTAAEGQIGGTGAYIEYSLDGFIRDGQTPGTIDLTNSRGRAIPERDMPIFNPQLTPNDFLKNESVEITPISVITSGPNEGEVENWNPSIGQLKVSTNKEVGVGDRIQGNITQAQGIVRSKINFKSHINTGAGATFISGWQKDTGFLNDSLQRLPNNEYYQNFSYSLQSEIPMEKWEDPVNVLNHTAGFDKYADLQIISVPTNTVEVGITTDESIDIVTDIVGEGSLNIFYDFDLVTEETVQLGGKAYYSDTINFENKILTDYYQSVGNRVVSIDDISDSFNSSSTGSQFSAIASYENAYKYNRLFVLAKDITYTDERQFSVVNILQHNNVGYLNEYGNQTTYNISDNFDDTTYPELGSFDYGPTDTGWELEFYPNKTVYNEYELTTIGFNVLDDSTSTGISTVGTISSITSAHEAVSSGTTTTVATIPITMRSAQLLCQLEDSDSNFSGTQINLIHDGTSVYSAEYGSLYTAGDPHVGFGTYHSYISGTNIKVDFTPDSSVTSALTSNVEIVGIATTAVGTGNTTLSAAVISSSYTAIGSTSSPTAVGITSYYTVGTAATSAAYYIMSIHDTTNDFYEMTEVCVLNSSTNESWIEFGTVQTSSGLGTVGIQSTGDYMELMYTPNASIAVQVRVFEVKPFIYDSNSYPTKLDLENAEVTSRNGFFYGTETQLEDTFELKHNSNAIFKRVFDGSDSTIVNITGSDTVAIGTHFFVTGEQIKYSYSGSSNDASGTTTNAIGIASTNVSGIGVTTKLPTTLYVVKSGEGYLKFTDTPTKALATTPTVFEIDAVGAGSSHVFTSINPNNRVLVAVDNMIQSPLSPTKVTVGLSTDILWQQQIPVTGFTSVFSGDLLQIGDEITKVIHVGYAGSTQLTVLRGQMGTTVANHGVGIAATKMSGTYNIVDNSVSFASNPHGNVPLSSTTNPPDARDWVGITTSSSFQGRMFMRRKAVDTTIAAYTENYIFDDISNEFTGITTEFTLTENGSNVSGISTFNGGIVLIKGVFQQPEGTQNEEAAYKFVENSGISTINFGVGSGSTVAAEGYDPNKTNFPIGGVIVSVGSSAGLGYQPLVAAGGSVTVAASGTITAVSIANSGSGYRAGIQSTVNVGIQTYSAGIASITGIGTAQIDSGHITGVTITQPHVAIYKPRDIVNVGYTSATGLTTVTTILPHGLFLGDNIELSGIAFTCQYAAPKTITNAVYSNTTGVMTVTTSSAHNLGIGTEVIFTGIGMTCDIDSGIKTHYYPRGRDFAYDNALTITEVDGNDITVDVGTASANNQYTHTFVSAATSAVVAGGAYTHRFVSALTGSLIGGGDYGHTFVSAGVGSITVAGIGTTTATNATYDASTGDMVLTIEGGTTATTSNTVSIAQSSITFTCAMDSHNSEHEYPRASDPIAGISTAITAVDGNKITINVGISTLVYYNVTDATYDGDTGYLELTVGSHGFTTSTVYGGTTAGISSVKLKNDSLTFRCSMDNYGTLHSYPRSTDPAYNTSVAVAATTSTTVSLFVGISTLVYYTPTAATYTGSTGIMTMTIGSNSLAVGDNIKLETDSLTFTCSKDSGISSHTYPRKPDPYYNGVGITSVPSTTSFVVNVGTSTVSTYYSSGGTVQKCIIAPRSAASDPAITGSEVLKVVDTKTFEVNTGISTLDHFYARGGTVNWPMEVVIDEPMAYENIPLQYSSDSASGIGSFATIDIVVGLGNSIINFSVDQTGVGYGNSEILTVPVGGLTGIPTDPSITFNEFQINIEETYTDSFNAWTVGVLEVLDRIESQFDGDKKTFGLKLNDSIISIQSKKGSLVEVHMVLLVFINDILQEPNVSYTFNGGSTLTFSTAPKAGDSCKILFYKGSGSVDVVFTDVLETVKVGDILDINNDSARGQSSGLNEDPRVVTGITTIDSVTTVIYPGPGITLDTTLTRPVNWHKQEYDKFVDAQPIGKDRVHYEPLIYPTAYILESVGVGTTNVYVSDVRPLFDQDNEVSDAGKADVQNSVVLQSQGTLTGAAATALVSTAGTVSSLDLTDGGEGYTSAPTVTISNASGTNETSTRATATATISGGEVSALTVSYGGTTTGVAYTTTDVPEVLIAPPTITRESVTVLDSNGYSGDYGAIVGIGTTNTASYDQFFFDLWITPDSFMRNSTYVGTAITVSGLDTGDYLTVFNTDVGIGATFATLTTTGGSIGIGTTWSDGVYQVASAELLELTDTSVVGVATWVKRIFVNVDDTKSGIGSTASPFVNGEFSWGKINFNTTPKNSYTFYGDNGVTGISTSGIIVRTKPLRYLNYS